MIQLRTARQVIMTLGGIKAVQRLTDTNDKAVYYWIYTNHFPARTYVLMINTLAQHGATAPASLWGMIEFPAESIRRRRAAHLK